MARGLRLPTSPRGAPMIDLATIARRRQAQTAVPPVDPSQLQAPPPGPALPMITGPSMTAPGGTVGDATAPPPASFAKGGKQVLRQPSAIIALKDVPRGVRIFATIDEFGRRQPETVQISHPGKTLKGKGASVKGARRYDLGGDLSAYTGNNGGTSDYTQTDQQSGNQSQDPNQNGGYGAPNINYGAAPATPAAAAPAQQPQAPPPQAPAYTPPTGQGTGPGSGNYNAGSLIGGAGPGSTGATAANIAQWQATQAALAAEQAQLNAQAGVYPAEAEQTAAKGQSLSAQAGVVAAQQGQTAAQTAYYAEQARAAAQNLSLEQARQQAQQNVPANAAEAVAAQVRGIENRYNAATGHAPLENVILPPGYNGPALPQGTQAAIETPEAVAQRAETNAAAINTQLTAEGQAAVGAAGTKVSTAQQGAALADIAAQRAGLGVETAQQQAGEATTTADIAKLAETESTTAPSPGLVFDQLIGQWVTQSEYAQSHALNRQVWDPVNEVETFREDLAANTDQYGNIFNKKTGQWQSVAQGGTKAENTFRDTTDLGVPGPHWVSIEDPTNVFENGRWVDTATGNFLVRIGTTGGEWHRIVDANNNVVPAGTPGSIEQRLDAEGQWVGLSTGGAATAVAANGAILPAGGPAANTSGLTPRGQ